MCFKKFFSLENLLFLLLLDVVSSNKFKKKKMQHKLRLKKIRVILVDLQRDDYQIIQISRLTKSHPDIEVYVYWYVLFFFNSVRFKTSFFFSFLHCDLNFNVLLQILFIFFFFLISAYAFCIVINQVAVHVCIEDEER